MFFYLINRSITFADEVIELHEVARGVTAYAHFTEQDQVAALRLSLINGSYDLTGHGFHGFGSRISWIVYTDLGMGIVDFTDL
jgi:hypothetical protein